MVGRCGAVALVAGGRLKGCHEHMLILGGMGCGVESGRGHVLVLGFVKRVL